jgi:hypothetical protein
VRYSSCSEGPEISRGFIDTAFKLCFTVCHYEGPSKGGWNESEWDKSFLVYVDNDKFLCEKVVKATSLV